MRIVRDATRPSCEERVGREAIGARHRERVAQGRRQLATRAFKLIVGRVILNRFDFAKGGAQGPIIKAFKSAWDFDFGHEQFR